MLAKDERDLLRARAMQLIGGRAPEGFGSDDLISLLDSEDALESRMLQERGDRSIEILESSLREARGALSSIVIIARTDPRGLGRCRLIAANILAPKPAKKRGK